MALAILLPACLIRESNVRSGPEQFQFTVLPRAGAGPEAEALAESNTGGVQQYVPGSARLIGTINTPIGQVDLLRFQTTIDGVLNDCEGEFGNFGSSWGCGPVGQQPINPLPVEADLAITGSGGSSDWSQAVIRVSDNVLRIEAVAEDGTMYSIAPAIGYGYIVWPTSRGDLTVTAYDGDGKELDSDRLMAVDVGPGATN